MGEPLTAGGRHPCPAADPASRPSGARSAVTVRRDATSAMAPASAAGTVRVRAQIIHSGVARPTAPIGRVRRQIGGSVRVSLGEG
jgi:hypothetical protein